MKNPILLLAMVLGGVAAGSVWTDHKGLTLAAERLSIDQSNPKVTIFQAKGAVKIDSELDGLTIWAQQVDFEALPTTSKAKKYRIQHAVASRDVKILRRVTTGKVLQTTQIEGPKADYTVGTDANVVRIVGPTRITSLDSASRQNMVATGSAGAAYLEPKAAVSSGNGLKKATLNGPVHIVFNQPATKSEKASTIVGDAKQMTMENIGAKRRVTLIGNVHLVGPDSSDVSGVQRAVFILENNRLWRLEATESK
jgi:hypothetical protein